MNKNWANGIIAGALAGAVIALVPLVLSLQGEPVLGLDRMGWAAIEAVLLFGLFGRAAYLKWSHHQLSQAIQALTPFREGPLEKPALKLLLEDLQKRNDEQHGLNLDVVMAKRELSHAALGISAPLAERLNRIYGAQ
ncbi:hypothetical protein GTO89_14080 [Heliobacterium gestii]|uniref:Uncharacterized protein n=1 Tax=Heliomicrobium gestii TaxID=2699 RepID=A0A845LBX3_HELGE|nr:hypothetical protein [Heliomicrobium gestii]MBM7867769.1 hypothetical protein [Heliomicrobium gestii]MZP44162.1 hypothetical protein [Heliomicrobium gestii]